MSVVPDSGTSEPWAETFVELYRAQRVAMVRLAHLLTAGDDAAEEIVHDAFLAVHRRWEHSDNPVGYLRTTVVNGCRSHLRRRSLADRVSRRSRPAPVFDAPDELADAIGRLPERQRTAVVLRYYADLPEAEIADALGCGIPAVKSLLHRALGTLREVIER